MFSDPPLFMWFPSPDQIGQSYRVKFTVTDQVPEGRLEDCETVTFTVIAPSPPAGSVPTPSTPVPVIHESSTLPAPAAAPQSVSHTLPVPPPASLQPPPGLLTRLGNIHMPVSPLRQEARPSVGRQTSVPQEPAAQVPSPQPFLQGPASAAEDPLDLQQEILTLRLDRDATADDLRRRDRLVARLSQLADPIARDELLELLAEQERRAETVQ